MRSRNEFLTEYAKSHTHGINQFIHLVCVPIIFFATTGLLWSVKLDAFLPATNSALSGLLNIALLLFIPVTLFYARLGFASLVTGLAWSVVSALACVAIEQTAFSLIWVSAVLWVAAWLLQFVGHHLEGAKPSFADDLVFLLIGPLFVQQKLNKMLRIGQSADPTNA